MMENEHKSFTDISIFSEVKVADHCIYDHDTSKDMKIIVKLLFLFFFIIFNEMKLLADV